MGSLQKRLGHSEGHQTHFDLNNLYEHKINPEVFIDLEKPFTHEEVDEVVKILPPNKSPRPDGFNNEFLKACWDIIREDVLNLIGDFHEGNVSLESINTSFITLIPQKEVPLTPNDFR